MGFLPMTNFRSLPGLIAMIRRVQSPRGRRHAGLFAIEGTRLVERALRAGAPMDDVLVAQHLIASPDQRYHDLFVALERGGCRINVAPDHVVADLTEGRDLGAILGLVRFPPPILLSSLLSGTVQHNDERAVPIGQSEPSILSGAPPILLAAVDIVDPGNVGALTRTAHAAGAAGMLVAGASDPYHPRATRISRGSIFKLPVIEYDSTAALLRELRQHPVALVGTAARDGTPLPRMEWPRLPTVILMGNEAEGLPAEVIATLDYTVTIPMPVGVDSYSVNAAAAIILFMAAQAGSI